VRASTRVRGLTSETLATQRLLPAVVALGVVILVGVSLSPPPQIDPIRLLFWIALTWTSAALPVKLPGGVTAHTTTAPIIAALFDPALPQPFAVCWVALVGTTELRDLRREIPWYGTLYNRSAYLIAAFVGWLGLELVRPVRPGSEPIGDLAGLLIAGIAFVGTNWALAVLAATFRTGTPLARVWRLSVRNVLTGYVALVPLGWLMAEVGAKVGLWAALLFMVPLQLARYSFTKYTETRDLFFGSISALSQAIDAKDGFTRGHADRVSRIAGAVARELGASEGAIEHIELAALLHDIGKIGVEDRILLKPSRLDPDETELMRRHPIYGASILEPSAALRPLVPIILAHHENYNGTGYPNGLKGEDIPFGARVILVSDAYEAMTSDRIYRKAIGHDKAMEQLHTYSGIQFDPRVVRALEALLAKRGAAAFDVSDLPPITYETLAELRGRLARREVAHSHAG
jgi:putative nucleotidyltransferase with HDIG domain